MVYRKGTAYVGSIGSIYIRHSGDGGANWSNEEVLFAEQSVDLRNIAGGYVSSGRLFLFYIRYNYQAQPPCLSMNYRYSDDDGQNWSNQQSLTTTLSGFSPYGHIIDAGNGVLYQPWYENNFIGPLPGNLTSCRYRLNLFNSINNGQNFSNLNIYDHTNSIQGGEQFFYTEFSFVNIGGGCFILLVRKDGYDFQEFHQFKSENNCQNWTSQGDTSFEQLSDYPAPPWLSFINYEGIGIVACYYTNRGTRKLNVVYGIAKDLLENGPSAWNI
ncbi:MAG: exo-alpha-sialidase, partial [Bacteroidales bacterium]|nr:exo-alpha-sialidase [Bacteroidales bacterium]